jgi:hypothetical protein
VLKADSRKQSAVGSSPVAVSRKLSAVSVLDELFFFVVAGEEDLAVLVEAVNETQQGVRGVSHQGLRIARAGEESSQRSKGKGQKERPQTRSGVACRLAGCGSRVAVSACGAGGPVGRGR